MTSQAPPTRPRLLLLDGHSLAYRAFYALPVENFSTTTGQPTNAVYGFTAMLINALRDEQPTHVAVAFDVSRQTFRTERYPEYKANRTTSPEPFKGQVELVKDVLDALAIPSVEVPGYEADDIIATMARQAEAEGFDVLIITGDRDTFQLVDDAVTVLYPRRGVSDLARMTPATVLEKYGLTPAQYPDFAALRGDPSDNLPSIPSVGEKTAIKWIAEYGSLSALLGNADQVKGKVGEALRAHVGQVEVNRALTELVCDVPLPIGLAETERRPFERAAVHEVFDALQFRVLRDRLFETFPEGAAAAAPVPGAAVHESPPVRVAAPGEVGAWLAGAGSPVAVSVRGAWGAGTGRVGALGLAAGRGDTLVVDLDVADASDRDALRAWFADPDRGKVLHDANGPMLALRAAGWPLRGLVGDTALAAYVVLPGQRTFDLVDLVPRFLHRDLPAPSAQSEQLSLDGVVESEALERLGILARATLDLHDVLLAEVAKRGGAGLLADVELPLVSLLVQMEATGIAVDLPLLRALEGQFAVDVAAAEADAHEAAGEVFNLGSPKQLQEILFGKMNLPRTKRIKTGYTTDADALQGLYATTGHPLLEAILRFRDASRLRQTVAGLIPLADAEHRVHTTFNQTVAATGRLSSTDPNLQNIPVRTEAGRRIREAFVVGAGFESLMTADYSQIEMRIMAHLCEDAGLIEAFTSGEDLHTTVASRVFGVPREAVDPEMRRRIKAMSYGLAYGLSAFGLGQQLGIEPSEARRLMDEYFERFGGVRDYLVGVVEQARLTGYTETLLGRRRYLPDLVSDNRQRREMAERMALNAPIQGSAADIIKVAMLRTDAALQAAGLRSRLLLQVHDELVLEIAPGEADRVAGLVRAAMSGAVELAVPLDVSIGVGPSWQAAAH
ncbi:MAG: DNA polymerase I [Candidatus Nanopelagicales bacterium]|nr:DNA polymerase I [Candidatus Nanopelagicales bacterium]